MLAWLRRQLDPPTILICIAVSSVGLTWLLLNAGAARSTLSSLCSSSDQSCLPSPPCSPSIAPPAANRKTPDLNRSKR